MKWAEKPYHSLDYMLKECFGEKVYKVTLNGGMSCPNRDDKLGTPGCIFCSAGGSGDFAVSMPDFSDLFSELTAPTSADSNHTEKPDKIAYFQAFTNTYAPVERLEYLYKEYIDF